MAAPFADVTFPRNSTDSLRGIDRARMNQQEFAHETLHLHVTVREGVAVDLRTNDPVMATLTSTTQLQVKPFVGYVHHVEDGVRQAKSAREATIVCVGATWPMRQARQRVFSDMTRSEIVIQILGEYRLTAEVETHTERLSHVTQSGESDWSFICRLAKQIGWVVYPQATVVHFCSRKHLDQEKVQMAPIFDYGKGDVDAFDPRVGDATPHAEGMKSDRIVGGVDPRTGQAIYSKADARPDRVRRAESPAAIFTTYQTGTVAHSLENAASKAQGSADAARWQHRAHAITVGDVTVQTASAVYMKNVPGAYEGFWYAIEVEHVFTGEDYSLDMRLGADSIGRSVDDYEPPDVPFARGRKTSTGQPKQVKAVLNAPGNYSDVDHRRLRGGPNPMQWVGSAARGVEMTLANKPATKPPSYARVRARAK